VLEGELYDKETESPLFIKDSETTASTEFNAITENGTAFLDFEINTSELEGKSIVVYERLYKLTNDNGWPSQELVATHEDISSYDQTVTVETKQSDTTTKSNETSGLATTGDRIALTVLFLMLGSAFFTLIAKRRKNN
jgi:hypothetical protein